MKRIIIATLLLQGVHSQAFDDTLANKLWGLKNTGQTILRRSGDLTRKAIKGTPGKDINWVDVRRTKIAKSIPEDREVVVAVLDFGIDKDHPDLKGKIYVDKKLCPTEEDRKEKPCSGINVLKKSLDVSDDDGHGTHVAGIISAVSNNQLGVTGVTDSRVKILPVKVLSKDVTGFTYDVKGTPENTRDDVLVTDIFADGIAYAIQRGAHVINMSIGWPKLVETKRMKRALAIAAQRNIAIIAAAGNNNKQIPTYPCTNETVICVGAVDNQGKITEFSNYGGKVDILAPGEFIISTYPLETVESRILRIRGYEAKNGTSQAAPFIAAIVASLKLKNPKMTLKEIKARLFSSARPRGESLQDGKFSKYGLVDMKNALLSEEVKFASPIFKDLLDLNYKSKDGSFFFGLPIESLVGEFKNLKVKVSFDRSDIVLEESEQQVSLRDGQKSSVLFKGKLTDLTRDAQFRMKVTLSDDEGFSSETETTIIFARDLAREGGLESNEITGFDENELTYFVNSDRRISRVKKVSGRLSTPNSPLYYTQVRSLQTDEETKISVLLRKEESWQRQELSLPKRFEVMNVSNDDFDLDGHADFLISGVSADQKTVTFDYLLKDQTVTFSFPILEHKNFPLEYTAFARLPLITMPLNKMGIKLLKVPTFYARYQLPDADNSDDILDRVPEGSMAPHQYFLNPVVKNDKMTFELRVVDSLTVLNTFRDQFFIESWQVVGLDKAFPQNQDERMAGTLKGLLTVGDEFVRDYYMYSMDKGRLNFERVFFPDRLLAGNNTRSLIDTTDKKIGMLGENVEFLAQLKRDQVRSYIWNPESKAGKALVIDTQKWSDPVFNSIIAYNNEKNSRLIETRYYLRAYNQEGEVGRLRINRESSFPGVQFSETLSPIVVKGDGENYPGLFINSTLIFGNRLYSMVEKDNEFIRPLVFSVDIPKTCVHMRPEVIDGQFHYVMMCRKGRGKIALETLPLAL